jgi:glutamate-1-semialdehyde 2,1-aminomutase
MTESGQELWKRAQQLIPGGNMLLSKRAEMHLAEGWPAYFSRAKGCRIWDLDDHEYIDVGLMGVGTNILGYGHPVVDDAVRRVVDDGNLSTLNCPEEVYLAERLVEMHPWADMVRLARSGGEACSIAVRIGRAATGKSAVAFCGYHGWHDWYLAANLGTDSALDGHLLPGLEPAGVPRGLEGTARPFLYNDLESLAQMLAAGDVGTIFMEVQRGQEPAPGFLAGVRRLADSHGAVLIFDECTSGFRRSLGGLHLAHGVEPDIATFGKTLGNGYAITAVVGRASVMQAAQSTFISSTFWTERIGPTAALAALDVMAAQDAPAVIDRIGLDVMGRWEQLGGAAGIDVVAGGLPALANFTVRGFDPVSVKTFVTQEMLKRGFIAGTSLYASTAHEPDVLDNYCDNLAAVFEMIATCNTDDDLAHRLEHGRAQSGFQRLA